MEGFMRDDKITWSCGYSETFTEYNKVNKHIHGS